MRISAKAAYACLAVIELAASTNVNTFRRVRDIAQAQSIPDRYLVQILLQLKAAGIVQSARGNEGGYLLVRRPEELSVADIIGVIDGPPPPPSRWVTSPAGVSLLDLLKRAWTAEQNILESTTIAELIRRNDAPNWDV
jgi:Rrf2 family protein